MGHVHQIQREHLRYINPRLSRARQGSAQERRSIGLHCVEYHRAVPHHQSRDARRRQRGQRGGMKPAKHKGASEVTVSGIEQEIKRALSDREISAIMNLRGQLPDDRRKRKRLIRTARESARLEDLKDPRILAARGEPTEEELRIAIDLLSSWQTPSLFFETVAALRRRIPVRKLMDRRYKPVREGIVLSSFCERRKVLAVRLGEDPPDGRVRFDADDDTPIEVTEALERGKRNDEYRIGSIPLLRQISDAELAQLADKMLQELGRRVEKKARKKYDVLPLLLVYLNFPHDRRAEKRIEETIERLRKDYAGRFQEIQVITDRRLF
jgi:hypothetical protein